MSAAAHPMVEHVFVLMLENGSFDNLLAYSGIPGVRHASPGDANSYRDISYEVGAPGAPVVMPTDPGHETADVVEQLCGRADALVPWQPYPTAIDNSGFVANYATTRSEFTKDSHRLPEPGEYRAVMACCDTPNQLPVLHQLARIGRSRAHPLGGYSRSVVVNRNDRRPGFRPPATAGASRRRLG